MIWNLRSAGQSSVGRKINSRSEFHDHAPPIFGSRRTPSSDGFFKSSKRAAGSLNRTTSAGNCSSLSSFVTGIAAMVAETRCGFGRAWYHFQAQIDPHVIRKIAMRSEAVLRGRLSPKRVEVENHRGGVQLTRPKIATQILVRNRPSTPNGQRMNSVSLETEAGIFML